MQIIDSDLYVYVLYKYTIYTATIDCSTIYIHSDIIYIHALFMIEAIRYIYIMCEYIKRKSLNVYAYVCII